MNFTLIAFLAFGHLCGWPARAREVLLPSFSVYIDKDYDASPTLTDGLYQRLLTDLRHANHHVLEQQRLMTLDVSLLAYGRDQLQIAPIRISPQWRQYAPSSMRIDRPGIEIGHNLPNDIFAESLHDHVLRLAKTRGAVSVAPTFIVSRQGTTVTAYLQSREGARELRVTGNDPVHAQALFWQALRGELD